MQFVYLFMQIMILYQT